MRLVLEHQSESPSLTATAAAWPSRSGSARKACVAGCSVNGALAHVRLDGALRDNVPSVFRQSPETNERRSSPAIGSVRGQGCSHEHKS